MPFSDDAAMPSNRWSFQLSAWDIALLSQLAGVTARTSETGMVYTLLAHAAGRLG
jgi:hypothetical protein